MATSYSNAGGSGNRSGLITVSVNGWSGGTPTSVLVDGLFGNPGWLTGTTRFEFQFPTAQIIDEAKFYQSGADTHGTWKWQGSNDGSTWVDLGASFTLGGSTLQTQTTLAGNTAGFARYRLERVSGSASTNPYIQEFEFKIAAGPPVGVEHAYTFIGMPV